MLKGASRVRERNYWLRKATSGRLSRRRFVGGAAATGVGAAGLALVGCGGDDDDDDTVDPTATTAPGETPQATATSAPGETPQPTATSAPTGPQTGGIAVTQSSTAYDSVDPHRTVASPVVIHTTAAQSKILGFTNPNTGEVRGDLAESWEQVDATTISVNLRKGVTWHDAGPGADNPASAAGRAFTADDVKWNIERQAGGLLADGSEAVFGRQSYWANVETVDVVDDTSFVLNLANPDVTFIQGLANEFNLMDQPELTTAMEGVHSEISADKVIGTGPYILTEWRLGETISAVRNPNYFLKDRPYLDARFWIQVLADPTAYRIAFEQKDVDSFSDPDPSVTMAIQAANEDDTYVKFGGVANTVAIYLPHTQEPWKDIRLVQAVHRAADRRQLIQQLHNGLGKLSGPVAWPQEAWAIPQEELQNIPGYLLDREEDIAEAKKLWDAADGSSAGEIKWVFPDLWTGRAGWGATPELITQMFNSAFDTDQFFPEVQTYGEIIPSWGTKDFDPFFAWIPNIEVPDARADMNLAFRSDSPGNIWGANEPDLLDAKMAKALTIFDVEEASAILREVQDTVLENGQYGRTIMYNYIAPTLYWNYFKATGPDEESGWNFLANYISQLDSWLDQNDPTFEGRGTPPIKTL
jgi:peptide/nickel transport system substrate-binding protein